MDGRALAAEVHLSRATLARRFAELVGEPPLTYLTRWRMDLAAQRLQATRPSRWRRSPAASATRPSTRSTAPSPATAASRPAATAEPPRNASARRWTKGHVHPRIDPHVHRRSRPTRLPPATPTCVPSSSTARSSARRSRATPTACSRSPRGLMERVGVRVDEVRTVDHDIPPGVWPDMREHGYDADDFPRHLPRARRAGRHHPDRRPDLARRPELDDAQDHRAPLRVLRRRQRPPASGPTTARSAACSRPATRTAASTSARRCSTRCSTSASRSRRSPTPTGTARPGPGPSYLDPDAGGERNAWTTRNTVFMTWNVLHLARMLKDAGGIPAYGNGTRDWDLVAARTIRTRSTA